MISQQMGLHYGSNYSLNGEGEYTAQISIGGMSFYRSGSFADAFESATTAIIPFTFTIDKLYDISIEEPKDGGTPGAIDPVSMSGVPIGQAPSIDAFPGHHAGTVVTDDAHLEVFVMTQERSERDTETPYLIVSARTPYNNIILPMMQLETTISQNEASITTKTLTRTLDPDLGYHYGASIPNLTQLSDELMLEIKTTIPPQIARHDGYETAFMNMDPVSLPLQIK